MRPLWYKFLNSIGIEYPIYNNNKENEVIEIIFLDTEYKSEFVCKHLEILSSDDAVIGFRIHGLQKILKQCETNDNDMKILQKEFEQWAEDFNYLGKD